MVAHSTGRQSMRPRSRFPTRCSISDAASPRARLNLALARRAGRRRGCVRAHRQGQAVPASMIAASDTPCSRSAYEPCHGKEASLDLRRPRRDDPVDTELAVYAHRRESTFHAARAEKVPGCHAGRLWRIPWPCATISRRLTNAYAAFKHGIDDRPGERSVVCLCSTPHRW